MIEFRWVGRQLQYRQRSFQVDASTHFCGVTDFGPWIVVPDNSQNEEDLILERDQAEDAANELASLVLGEPIDWAFHDVAWKRAIDKLKSA